MSENANETRKPPTATEVLRGSVASEVSILVEEIQAARGKDPAAVASLVEALANIKLNVTATAIRVEVNLRRMVPPDALSQRAAEARAKLRGLQPEDEEG